MVATNHSKFILAIDQGTTSSRALIFDRQFNVAACAQKEFSQHFPNDGWVEHDALEIWQSVLSTSRDAIAQAQISATQIAGIAITNQRETTVVWNRATGEPVGPAIVWQDRRTQDLCKSLRDAGLEPEIQSKTGLLLDPYFSATKIQWLLDNIAGARRQAEQGLLACGTVDSWLLWQLTSGQQHKTDATNASRTQLYNLSTGDWDPELLNHFKIPKSLLPAIQDNASTFGRCAPHWLGAEIPVVAMVGDQQGALLGQACTEPGQAKCTYGTGAFLMVNAGKKLPHSNHRLLTTLAYRINGVSHYANEGAIFVAGAAIQWLRDGLQVIHKASECTALMKQYESGLSPVVLVPAFTGLGAPYWNPEARGAVFGLTRDTSIADLVVGALQSIALQTHDLVSALEADDVSITELRVDGGMTTNGPLLQCIADIIDRTVRLPVHQEMTVLGAAYLAGLSLGWIEELSELALLRPKDKQFQPRLDSAERKNLLNAWQRAIKSTQVFAG